MIQGRKVLAIIPARAGSKGVKRKNIRDLCGKPLLSWPIRAAAESKYVDKIILSTDDPDFAAVGEKYGAEVPFLRPKELASDTATSFAVIEHVLNSFEGKDESFEYLILLEPTSPLTEAIDIDSALGKLHENRIIADSIVGVSKVEAAHPTFDVIINPDGLLESFMPEGFLHAGRRQDLKPLFFFEGSLYISTVSALLREKGFYHKKTLPYIVPRWKSFEIDEEIDFICVEAIMNHKKQLSGG